MQRSALEVLKADAFVIADPAQRDAMLMATVPCLADTDPSLRDGFAYEAYAHWLSSEVAPATLKRLQSALLAQMDAEDPRMESRIHLPQLCCDFWHAWMHSVTGCWQTSVRP